MGAVEIHLQDRSKKPWTKPPFHPSGQLAKSDDSTTWGDFGTVWARYQKGGFDGIGFMLTPACGIVGGDIDNALDASGQFHDLEVLGELHDLDTYTEISPSGTGLRFFARGILPAQGRKRGPYELYDSGRFLTVTGHQLPGTTATTINERSLEIAAWHGKRIAPPQEAKDGIRLPPTLPALSDQELIDKACQARNGSGLKFQRLWQGDAAEYGGDHSRADLALCQHLAFWTRCDFHRMDTLFRSSKLMRAKWDERHRSDGATYGRITIERAISQCSTTYDPASVITPVIVDIDAVQKPVSRDENGEFALNDIGNGQRFAAANRADLRYCSVRAQWQVYKNGAWQPDVKGEAENRAKSISRALTQVAAQTADDDKHDQLIKHARLLTRRSTRDTMLKDAACEPEMMVTLEMFDRNLHAFNCKNGTLDLKTGQFSNHRAEDLLTRQAAISYDRDANCPTWQNCIRKWMPDEETGLFMQEAVGASLCGELYDEFFLFLYGNGENGKSTFLRVLEQMVGTYGHKAEAESFMRAREARKSGGASPELLALKGARLVTVQEIDADHSLNTTLIKDLTGRDTITARGLYNNRMTTFVPQCTIWMVGNGHPQIHDLSHGMWRRPRLIEFGRTIPRNERDPQLGAKLQRELPGDSELGL